LAEASDPLDPANSRYYLVVVQYTDKINSQKLNNYVQNELGGGKLGRKKYNFRLAPEDSAADLTGFIRNGVSPFGALIELMRCSRCSYPLDKTGLKSKVPVIVTENITNLQPPIVYFGAGHPDHKIMCPTAEFISVTKAMVTDLA
jgi:prolyl-tRNA editing enzyme YbaK/EbsC (Cys-tRNA(Pro) deacylase)